VPGPVYSETNGTFDWYVMTQGQVDLINGTHIANGTVVTDQFIASGHYDVATAGANTIGITWNGAALATGLPYFLVVVYSDPTATCATNNIKVYRVEPQNTFWLAVSSSTYTQCAPNVSAATLNAAGDQVEYLYGQNTIVVTAVASGYTGNWDAQLDIDGFSDDQSIVVSWAGSSGGSGTFTPAGTINGIYDATLPSVVDGETITITIVVTNNHFEGLADQTIPIALNGSYTSGTSTFYDLWAGVDGDACLPDPGFSDVVTHTISARPTVNPVNPAAFVPQVTP
jgi:hypothetical protein